MSIKRNRLDAGFELEPRVMLAGAVPGAEAPVANEAEAAPEAEATADDTAAETAAPEDASAEASVVAEETATTQTEVAGADVVEEPAAVEAAAEEVVPGEVVPEEVTVDEVVAAEEEAIVEADAAIVPVVEETVEEVAATEAVTEEPVDEDVAAVVAAAAEETNVEANAAIVPVAQEVADEAAEAIAVVADATSETGIVVGEGEAAVNPEGGSITSAGTAVEINGEATVDNAGLIAGDVSAVEFTETGSGTLNNSDTGVISSDNRAIDINGTGSTQAAFDENGEFFFDVTTIDINNSGQIIGTGDQSNGTVSAASTAEEFTLVNDGLIDAGEGNDGAGVAAELAEANPPSQFDGPSAFLGGPSGGSEFEIENTGVIQGRGDAADSAATAGDGIRLEPPRVDGELDGTTEGLFNGTITNDGVIDSESDSGDTAGIRVVEGATFNGDLINNGTISGTRNGVDLGDDFTAGAFVENNGVISSDSQALSLGDSEISLGGEIINNGEIVGTDDQRNGTVFIEETAVEFTNNGLIDAGEGNDGAGVSIEADSSVDPTQDFFVNSFGGQIQGRGNADADLGTAGDGIRIEPERVDGVLDGTTTGTIEGVFINLSEINSESENEDVAGFRVADGVDFTGSLRNEGTISGTQNGVSFGDGDHIRNRGFTVDTPGLVTNEEGIISSDSRAFNLDGTGLEINNTGDIIGTDDQRNGTFFASSTAQDFTLNNDGLIDAGEGNDGAGISVELAAGGFGSPSAAIFGDGFVGGSDFVIENTGVIQGRGDAADGLATAGDGIRLEQPRVDGVLDDSLAGLGGGLFIGEINNSGLINAESNNGDVAGFRVTEGAAFGGELTNNGTISGTQNGVDLGGNFTSGDVQNNGLISSDSRAVSIGGGEGRNGGEFTNNGAIVGTDDQRNGTVFFDEGSVDFNNLGLIDAGEGNDGSGITIEAQPSGSLGPLISNFNNTGLIQGRGNAIAGDATAGDGVRFEQTRVDGALDATNTDQIFTVFDNSGIINSEGDNGAVSGFRVADGVGFIGDLNNSGTISGTQNGVYFGDGVHEAGFPVGDVNNTGTISSDSRAFNIDGTGLQVNNDGVIIGTDNQRNGTVYADSTAQDFTLNNDGLIDAGDGNEGAGFSAELSEVGNDFTIANTEAIRGRGDAAAETAAAGDGVRLERTRVDGALDGSTTGLFTGSITNDGIFEAADGTNGTVAGFRAVDGVDFQGTLDNTGFITGSQNGVYFGEGDHTGGVVTNSGLITSDSRAVNIDGEGLAFENSGLIEATDRQRNGTVYVDGTANNFEVTNVGTIDAAGGGSGVSVEVGSETGDVQSGSIINGGTIIGTGELAEDAGVRLSAGAEGETTFAGDIINTGTITSEDVAILVEEGVLFDGDVINNGTIDGEIDLASGGIVLNDGSIVYLDVAGVNDVEQISTEDEVTFGGELNVRFTEGFVPEFGQTFDLIDFGASSGNFSSVAAEGFEFDTSNLAIDGTITVVGQDGVVEVVAVDDIADGDVVLGDASVAADLADAEAATVEAATAEAATAEVAAFEEVTVDAAAVEEVAAVEAAAVVEEAPAEPSQAELSRQERQSQRQQERREARVASRVEARQSARAATRSSFARLN